MNPLSAFYRDVVRQGDAKVSKNTFTEKMKELATKTFSKTLNAQQWHVHKDFKKKCVV